MVFSWNFSSIHRAFRSHSHSRPKKRQPSRLQLLDLESRALPSASLPLAHTGYAAISPSATSGPTGYTPAQIEQAYGINQISFSGVTGNGSGETIAIVDAYDDPTIASDLQAFDSKFGLSNPTFTKVNETGGSTLPAANTSWSEEISLDVEWAHAIAPKANILLVEASSTSDSDLFTAIQYAAKQPGVAVVSMSWGGSEFSGETSYDSYFTTPSGHTNVAFVASAGDDGAPVEYPAGSPNVLAVGGTTLELTSSNNYSSESAWSDSGGGLSSYESQPAYQKGVVTQSTTARANPDVAYDADPNTGFPVYDSYAFGTTDPWEQFGGTSDAAPQWAALVAIADQGRAAAGEAALSSSSLLTAIYQLPAADFHDITTGATDGSPNYSAGPGYDLTTGRGTPVANLLVPGLVGTTTTTPPVTTAVSFTVTGATFATAGSSYTITVTALTSSNQVATGYTGTVHFTSSDSHAILPANATLTNGTGTFTVTFETAGSQTVTATDTSFSSITGVDSGITVNPGTATHLAFEQQPTSGTVAVAISPAVTVELFDAYGNVVTTDNTDKVTLSLRTNPGSATLSGGGALTAVNGIATFSGLTLSAAGTGYTLSATSGSLPAVASSSFNITAAASAPTSTVIENFTNGLGLYYYIGTSYPDVAITTAAAHTATATYGLDNGGDGNWYFRQDSGAQVEPGEAITVWVDLSSAANGRAYFAFGLTDEGAMSLVLAPNTNQLIIQNNSGFNNYTSLSAVTQTYQANVWYKLEVDWGTTGIVTGKLYSSNGTTLLNSVTASTGDTTPGSFGFRATGSDKYWDTVAVAPLATSSIAVAISQTTSQSEEMLLAFYAENDALPDPFSSSTTKNSMFGWW